MELQDPIDVGHTHVQIEAGGVGPTGVVVAGCLNLEHIAVNLDLFHIPARVAEARTVHQPATGVPDVAIELGLGYHN